MPGCRINGGMIALFSDDHKNEHVTPDGSILLNWPGTENVRPQPSACPNEWHALDQGIVIRCLRSIGCSTRRGWFPLSTFAFGVVGLVFNEIASYARQTSGPRVMNPGKWCSIGKIAT